MTKLVCGELDWIVMKALEKDRTRRYQTANGFAMDIQRYLAGEPVLAAPPSARYRLRKFVRKYRAALTTAAAMIVLLLVGAAFSTWQAVRALRAEAAARAAEHEAEARQAEAERQKSRAEIRLQEASEYAAKLQVSEAQAKANARSAMDAEVLAENSARQAKESQRQAEDMAKKLIEAQSRETAARIDALLPNAQFSKVEISYLEELVGTAEGNVRFVEARWKAGYKATGLDLLEAKARLCMAKGRLAWAKGDFLQCQKEYDDAVAAWKRRVDIVIVQYRVGAVDYPTLVAAEAAGKEAELCAAR